MTWHTTEDRRRSIQVAIHDRAGRLVLGNKHNQESQEENHGNHTTAKGLEAKFAAARGGNWFILTFFFDSNFNVVAIAMVAVVEVDAAFGFGEHDGRG